MVDGTRFIRFATLRLSAAALIIGLATFAAAVLPAASASAAQSTSVRSTPLGALLATLSDPVGTADDYFGYSVAVSGSAAIVGASDTHRDAGEAYIYVKSASGWPTTPTTTLYDPGETADDYFGQSVAVSGNTVVVGADGTNSFVGAAYIYVKGASGWSADPTVTLSDPTATADDYFGRSVTVSGKTVVVGDPDSEGGEAYLYVKGASGWPTSPTVTLAAPAEDSFGTSVAVSGKTVVVGTFGANPYAGTAYIYVKGTSGWPTSPTVTLVDPAATEGDQFGYSVAVSGTTVIVGAFATGSHTGKAYIYVKGASGWPSTPTTTLSDPAATSDDVFGVSVAVSGSAAVIGSIGTNSDAGATYIYAKGTSGWPTAPTVALSDPEATANDVFGVSVAVSGKTGVVGAIGTNSSAGAAYIYKA